MCGLCLRCVYTLALCVVTVNTTCHTVHMTTTGTKTRPGHFRIPEDVLTAAKHRATSEHRTLTDATVRLLRAYGEGDPAALAIVAGIPPGLLGAPSPQPGAGNPP